jgi:hypothetical protein
MTALVESPVPVTPTPPPPPAPKLSLLDQLKARLVTDWRNLLKLATVRLHLIAIAIGSIYAAMPTLDPTIAAALPAPLQAKAIAAYAVVGLIFRSFKLSPGG